MRLWSIHPKYLDSQGLVALWREALLAKKVLQNKTKGYKNHPQLDRFKNQPSPISAINSYLETIYDESIKRNYNFNKSKIGRVSKYNVITVSSGQIKYEFTHLLKKIQKRDHIRYNKYKETKRIEINPILKKVSGNIEKWEKLKHL
jgi:hypothetical protein